MDFRNRERRGIPRGWYLLALAAAACVVLAATDRWLKQAPHPGFCPAEADWVAEMPDLPFFWDALKRLEVAQALAEETPRQLHSVELAVRKGTGVRPTPARWGVWFGSRALAAGKDGAWGLCVRPGILLRAMSVLHGAAGGSADAAEYRAWGEYRYLWKGGYLLISRSPQYLQDAEKALPYETLRRTPPEGLLLSWRGTPEGQALIRAVPGLPVSGRIAAPLTRVSRYLKLAGSWQPTPLVSVSVSHWGDLAQLSRLCVRLVSQLPQGAGLMAFASSTVAAWDLACPAFEEMPIQEYALALTGLDTSEPLPVPEVALLMRPKRPIDLNAPHPLLGLGEGGSRVPAAWRGRTGWVLPVLGEKLSICISDDGGCWIAASQEPVMAKLAGHAFGSGGIDAAASLFVNWPRLSEAGAALVRRAVELELIPRTGLRDADAALFPLFRAMARFGELRINAWPDGGGMQFEGHLARQAGEEP